MLCSSDWLFLSKTITASLNKLTRSRHGTRYKMIDNMFRLQVVEIQMLNPYFTGVVQSSGARPLFQAQNSLEQRLSRHGWDLVRDFGMLPVNKC